VAYCQPCGARYHTIGTRTQHTTFVFCFTHLSLCFFSVQPPPFRLFSRDSCLCHDFSNLVNHSALFLLLNLLNLMRCAMVSPGLVSPDVLICCSFMSRRMFCPSLCGIISFSFIFAIVLSITVASTFAWASQLPGNLQHHFYSVLLRQPIAS